MSKGLLKIPQGVSTVFIQSHQTTYTIPQAVWESLQERYDLFPSLKDTNKNNRIDDLSRQFEDQVEALLSDSSSKAKT
jgi:protein involved in sex pheromone biosynthesis